MLEWMGKQKVVNHHNDVPFHVVYADACTLSPEELEKMHITFKKIPRDVTRF